MAKVCFKNTLDEAKEFESVEAINVLNAIHKYASSKEINTYQTIMQEKISIYLNNELLDVENWVTEISEDDIIIIVPAIEGKNGVVQTLIGVALMIIAPYTGAWAGFLRAAGLSLALGGVSNLLFQPDLPVLPSYSSNANAGSQTYNWSGIKTTAQLDTPIPIVYGTHAVGGNIISLYTETISGYNYLYMLLGLCEGEIEGICQEKDHTQVCSTSDTTDVDYMTPAITLDDQPIRNFDDVQWWYRSGTNLPDATKDQYYPFAQNMIPYFSSSRIQYDDSRELTSSDWTTYTATKKVDILTVRLEAPALYKINEDTGDVEPYTITYKMQWKKVADGTWNDLSLTRFSALVSSTNANTEYCTVIYSNSDEKLGVKPDSYIVVVTSKTDVAGNGSQTDPYTTTTTSYPTIGIDIYDADNNFIESKTMHGIHTITQTSNPSTGEVITNDDFVNPSFIVGSYHIEFEYSGIQVGATYTLSSESDGSVSEFTMTGKSRSGVYNSKSIDFNDISDGIDFYEIRIKRVDLLSSSFRVENKLILDSVTEVVQGKFIYPNTALLGFRIKATDQLSGSPPNVITVLKGTKVEVPDLEDASPSGTDVTFEDCFWNGDTSTWEKYDDSEVYWNNTSSWRKEYTENFMCCARDLLINERYGVGEYISKSNINKTDLALGIKECHRAYYPDVDYARWWDSGKNSSWEDHWRILNSTPTIGNYVIDGDSTYRYIDITSTFATSLGVSIGSFVFQIDLSQSFVRGQKYTISLTLWPYDVESTGNTITSIEVRGRSTSGADTLGTLDFINSNTGSDTYDITVTALRSYDRLEFYFKSRVVIVGATSWGLNFRIEDISIAKGNAPVSETQDVSVSGGKEHFHTFNGVLETDKSALTALAEICEAFRCWPTWYSGTFGFIMDTDTTPVHTITMGNDKSFKQNFTPVSELPYRLIGQYTDESVNYDMRSVVVKSSAKNVNKTNEQTIGMKGLTDFNRVARELKWKMDVIENCNRLIEIECDVDAVHCTAGDIFYFQDDLPQWGQGGRILDYTATHIILDQKYTFTNVATDTHIVRFQDSLNNFNVATVDHTHISNNASLQVIPVENLVASPCIDSVYAVGNSTQDIKKFRAFYVGRGDGNSIKIIAREHISSIYTDPDFVVSEVSISTMPNVLAQPLPLKNVVITQLNMFEGKGFNIGIVLDSNDSLTKEIVVQIDRSGGTYFETILTFPINQSQAKYIDNTLQFNTDYTFRVFGRSQFKQGPATIVTARIKKATYSWQLPPPAGLSVKDSNNINFKGKDVTITWYGVGSSIGETLGYQVDVLYTAPTDTPIIGPANSSNRDWNDILRSDFVSDLKYTYTLEMNEQDCARLGLPQTSYSTFYIRVSTVVNNIYNNSYISDYYSFIEVVNTPPVTLTGLSSEPEVGGVRFSWVKSAELDHKYYKFRTLVGGSNWSSWINTDNSIVTKALSTSDISNYGSRATVHFEVKDVDFYGQQSNIASLTASANALSDNLYQTLITISGGYSGNIASLSDGNYSSGGVIIT